MLSCLSLLTQTMPTSRKYHFCLCDALVRHTVQGDPIYCISLFQMWSLTTHSRGQIHNHCRISPDNHCGDAGKCTTSKQRKCGCMFVVYPQFPLCVLYVLICSHMWMCILCVQLHCCDDCYPVTDKTQEIFWVLGTPQEWSPPRNRTGKWGNLRQMWSEDTDVFIMISFFFLLWLVLSRQGLTVSFYSPSCQKDKLEPWTICSIRQASLPILLHKSQLPGDSWKDSTSGNQIELSERAPLSK